LPAPTLRRRELDGDIVAGYEPKPTVSRKTGNGTSKRVSRSPYVVEEAGFVGNYGWLLFLRFKSDILRWRSDILRWSKEQQGISDVSPSEDRPIITAEYGCLPSYEN
jgi:hypothetical protein